jgi:hypothetical protein
MTTRSGSGLELDRDGESGRAPLVKAFAGAPAVVLGSECLAGSQFLVGIGDVTRDRLHGARQIGAQLAGTADPDANARLLPEISDPIGSLAASGEQIEGAADLGEPDLDRARKAGNAPDRRQIGEIRRHLP